MSPKAPPTKGVPRSKRPPSAASVTFPISSQGEFYNTRFVLCDQNYGAAHTAAHLTTHTGDTFPHFQAQSLSFNLSTPGSIGTGSQAMRISRSKSRSEQSSTPEPPPPKRPCTTANKNKSMTPRLKITRPVQTKIAEDVWRLVLCRAEPAFLIEHQLTGRLFSNLLREEDTIWQQSRLNHYGYEIPETPFEGERKEQKFAILLAGKGCQNRNCSKVRTNKVFWAFRLRLCEECFGQRTKRGDVVSTLASSSMVQTQNLLELLPAGSALSGKYRKSREYNEANSSWVEPVEKLIFLLSDVEKIEAECQQVVQSGEDMQAWKAEKRNAVRELMRKTSAIETWEKQNRGNTENFREARQKFFETRAAELSPPLLPEALQHMVAFHKALESRRNESEQCWNVLKTKLLPHREDAERLAEWERLAKSFEPNKMPETESLVALQTYRSGRSHNLRYRNEEQTFVAGIAQKQLKACIQGGVPDEDLVLSCLHRVFERFKTDEKVIADTPKGIITDGTKKKYKLSLDDARLIVEDIITPELGENSRRIDAVLGGFRCKGCIRTDCTKKYDFKSAFHHIYAKHAKLVGDGYHFDYFAKPLPNFGPDTNIRFPWLTVLWPRNLPIAASYDDVSRKEPWKPDDLSEYSRKAKKGAVSAFEGRKAYCNGQHTGREFSKNIVYAASKLKDTKLSGEVQTKIALRYALDLYSPFSSTGLTVDDFANSASEISAANPAMHFRFRCGTCVQNKSDLRGKQFIKHPVAFHVLLEHWKGKHAESDWKTTLMDLPDDFGVWNAIEVSDNNLGNEKTATAVREASMKATAKKKPNLKAGVILGKRFGATVLNELFPLIMS